MDCNLIKELPFWDKLSESEKKIFSESCIKKEYDDKELIYSPERECLGLIMVSSGVARVYFTDEKGNTATIFRLRKGEYCILSMSCIMQGVTFDVEIEAEGKCSLEIIPLLVFTSVAEKNMAVENFSFRTLTEKFSYVIKAMQKLLFMSLEGRVISFLLEESEKTDSNTIIITHEQISLAIGSAREAVSRIINKLSKDGLITSKRGKIIIEDKKALEKLID